MELLDEAREWHHETYATMSTLPSMPIPGALVRTRPAPAGIVYDNNNNNNNKMVVSELGQR